MYFTMIVRWVGRLSALGPDPQDRAGREPWEAVAFLADRTIDGVRGNQGPHARVAGGGWGRGGRQQDTRRGVGGLGGLPHSSLHHPLKQSPFPASHSLT